jgi:hypothetical protein
MSNDLWCVAAEAALLEAGGASLVDRLHAEDQALPPMPVISVFGAYDAGKSTLLKRLLVEAGVEVPSWLTVSARRETFEVNAVEAFGCLLRDTPGIAAGSTSHEGLAIEAVAGSDVVMLVMPPQLLTGDRDRTLSILSGKAFRPGGLSLANSLLVVIAKLDEGAVDPVEDPSTYNEYLLRKRQEWKTLLEASEVHVTDAPVFAVSADPFQRVGNAAAPVREDYDEEYRAWDGVLELVYAFNDLPGRLPALRRAGRVRRLCWHLWANLDAIEDKLMQISTTQEEVVQTKKRFANFASKIDALLEVARDELDRAVSEALLTFARRGNAAPEEVADQLDGCITRWEKNQTAALDKLIGESDIELETRERARRSIAIATEEVASSRLKLSIDKTIFENLTTHAKTMFDNYTSFHLGGKTLKEARDSILVKPDPKLTPEQVTAHEIIIAETKQKVKKFAKADLVISLVPHLINLGSILYGEYEKIQDAKEKEAHRADARRALRDLGKQISNEAWAHFSTQAKAFSDWVSDNISQANEMIEFLHAEEARLNSASQRLRMALEREPTT